MKSGQRFMRLAIDEARKSVAEDEAPRPKVGSVAVKGNRMLGKAHRGERPGWHAEQLLLDKLGEVSLAGATVYTTLEPCTSRKHNIPCAQLLVERKVKLVVIGLIDPNREISGEGVLVLQEAGIDTAWFPSNLRDELSELNREFIRVHRGLRSGVRVSGEPEPREPENCRQALYALTSANLNRLITAMGSEARKQVSEQAPLVQRVNELIAWVESSSGPGLDKLCQRAMEVIPNLSIGPSQFPVAGRANRSERSHSSITVNRPQMRDALGDILRIRGGKPLRGNITVRGAKNTLPKDMLASLLTADACILRNVANIRDVATVGSIITSLGGTVELKDGVLFLSTAKIEAATLENLSTFSGQTRVSTLLCAPLLHRFGRAFVPKPGGCYLGKRAIDYHVDALKRMGADVKERADGLQVTAKGGLHGCEIRFPYPSVGATEQVLLAASLAHGTTVLSNASIEPEVIDLIDLLTQMGADIIWDERRHITINGKPALVGFDFEAMTDRSEIGSWACAAIATGGSIFVENAQELPLRGFLDKYAQMGGEIEVALHGIRFGVREYPLKPIDVETGSHPSFRSDWQPPMVAALTQASGVSMVHETVFEDRLQYLLNLQRMKARISSTQDCLGTVVCRFSGADRHSATVQGPTPLSAADITIDDLRGGFACIIAALVAHGESIVRGVSLLNKGYEDITQKLSAVGADFDNS